MGIFSSETTVLMAAEVRKLAEGSKISDLEIGEVSCCSIELAERAAKFLDEIVTSIKKRHQILYRNYSFFGRGGDCNG